MSNTMPIYLEIWPLAADSAGIWLVSGDDAWRPKIAVMSDSEPHWDVELELGLRKVKDRALLVHSTSWRVEGQYLVLTYVVVLDAGEQAVRERWPEALPVSAALAQVVGPAPSLAASEAPAPRYVDVLLHAVRHIRFLLDTDATAAEALPPSWTDHLLPLRPELARMYSQPYRP